VVQKALSQFMEFKFSCPHCNQHISVNMDMVGIQAPCPGCQQQIIVPAPPAQIELGANRPSREEIKLPCGNLLDFVS
jgi:transcription elongation factor Elf1